MSEKQNKNVTVRVQKIKKNHIKQKLVFFLILAIGLVILAVFSEHLCPYDPYAQDLASALQPPSLQHPMGTDTYGRDMLYVLLSLGLYLPWRLRLFLGEAFRMLL